MGGKPKLVSNWDDMDGYNRLVFYRKLRSAAGIQMRNVGITWRQSDIIVLRNLEI